MRCSRPVPALLTAMLLGLAAACTDQPPPLDPGGAKPLAAADHQQTVEVAPPTGIYEQDRANIVAAVEQLQPGSTLQFGQGTYLIGDVTPGSFNYLPVPVPGTTLLGHPNGTTLRGCDPASIVSGSCVGLRLMGGHQTARDLNFADFGQALILGAAPPWDPIATVGGYVVENNTFRASTFAVRSFGQWTEPAVVRTNTFVDTGIAVQVWGMTVHVADNDVSAPDWGQIPNWLEPDAAITIYSWDNFQTGPCDHNVVEQNRVEHHPWGVFLWAGDPQSGCRHNVIRGNTFLDSPELDPYPAGPIWLENSTPDPERLSHNRIEENHILGSQGVGVYVYRSTENQIVGNTIEAVTLSQFNPVWLGEGNGSGIWISPASVENEIHGTTFDDVRMYDVVFEGHFNTFATMNASDVLYDLGAGNVLTGPGNRVRNLPAPSLLGSPTSGAEATPRMHRSAGVRARALEP